jgi:hypothetical protein
LGVIVLLGSGEEDIYPEAVSARVEGGHLIVEDAGRHTLGVYAPNFWFRAHVRSAVSDE